MKKYTFVYFDSVSDFNADKRSHFVFTASRLSVAFKAFYDFVVKTYFNYFTFAVFYFVESNGTKYFRFLPSKYYYCLDSLREILNETEN